MTHAELIAQFKRFHDENSMESRIKRIQDDPTIDVMRKRELIADIVAPGRHDIKVEYKPSELPGNVGRMLGIVAGAALPWKLTDSSSSPLTRGLISGLGGIAGYFGGGLLGSGVSDVLTGPTVKYQQRGTTAYHPLMGLIHGELKNV
jgi:hypothetical protein